MDAAACSAVVMRGKIDLFDFVDWMIWNIWMIYILYIYLFFLNLFFIFTYTLYNLYMLYLYILYSYYMLLFLFIYIMYIFTYCDKHNKINKHMQWQKKKKGLAVTSLQMANLQFPRMTPMRREVKKLLRKGTKAWWYVAEVVHFSKEKHQFMWSSCGQPFCCWLLWRHQEVKGVAMVPCMAK